MMLPAQTSIYTLLFAGWKSVKPVCTQITKVIEMLLNSLPSKIKKFKEGKHSLKMSAAALKNTHQSSREKEKLSRRLLKRFSGKIERILIKISHFHSVRIWDKKRKSTMNKFDEGKFLHDIKTSAFHGVQDRMTR